MTPRDKAGLVRLICDVVGSRPMETASTREAEAILDAIAAAGLAIVPAEPTAEMEADLRIRAQGFLPMYRLWIAAGRVDIERSE